MVEATSVPEEPYSWDDWKRVYAVEAARKESQSSKLPGRENGPADAYRHLLWAGELTRRFGEKRARLILGAHEIEGRILGQSPDAESMDRHNTSSVSPSAKRPALGRTSSRAPKRSSIAVIE